MFSHSVASFDPTATSILLWTREPSLDQLVCEVALDAGFNDVIRSINVALAHNRDHIAIVDVGDLDPATTYWYRFVGESTSSPVGRTRTLPVKGGVRLGLVSCARFSVAPYGVYRALAEREVDLVLHLGDYIYEDDGHKGQREHDPPHEAVALDDYRRRLAQARSDADCQAVHLRHPMVTCLDDHDLADNCWSTGSKHHREDWDGPWSERVTAALKAHQEWLPARTGERDFKRLWRNIDLGDVGTLLLLDTRTAGRDRHAGDEGTKDLHDETRSLLGNEQREWLHTSLRENERPWSLIASGVVMSEVSLPMPSLPGLDALAPNGYTSMDGKVMHDDQWDGYPAERNKLTRVLDERGAAGRRSVVLSGDIHSSWAFEAPHNEDGTPVAVEFVVPPVSSAPMGRSQFPGAWRLLDLLVRRITHAVWTDVSHRGYAILDVTKDAVHIEWWFVEATSRDPGGTATLGKSLECLREPWPPKLRESMPLKDLERPTGPSLPKRPEDLTHLRRHHILRVSVMRSVGLTATAALILTVRKLLRKK